MSTSETNQASEALTVAVTGPTGEIGKPFVGFLEAAPEVGRVLAIGRRPFDPAELGWRKTEYRRGDILDREAIDELVAGSDVVVHLAFIVVEATTSSREINVEGSRNVFEATVAAGVPRLVYTSSVAAYGYGGDREGPLTEDDPARGTDRHAYSHQKAEVERVLREALADAGTDAYVFRPCVVAGPQSPALIEQLPYVRLERSVPSALRRLAGRLPGVKPVLPDHGVPFQLVHHDDVAGAVRAAVVGSGPAGTYNLAAAEPITVGDVAAALGWHSVPVPGIALDALAAVLAHAPLVPAQARWITAVRKPVLMDTAKVRRALRWRPRHGVRETLAETVAGARAAGVI
jgi:nucleoside-diphosphate-sugar epimerase